MSVLRQLLKMLVAGTFIFIGVSCALTSFGVIETWGVFSTPDSAWLWDRIDHPWNAVAAVVWFGVGVLQFSRSNG
jgi:hypothetical protein